MNLIQLEKIDTTNEYGGTVFLIHANFGFFKLKPKAIFFDLDDTIVADDAVYEKAWQGMTLYLKQCVKVSFGGWVWQAD